MEVNFKTEALLDLDYWYKYGSKSEQNKITSLLQNIRETPFNGTEKLESLKYDLSGKWSRRINGKDRIVYSVENDIITIYSLRGHYFKR
jgi:toxin YoeB